MWNILLRLLRHKKPYWNAHIKCNGKNCYEFGNSKKKKWREVWKKWMSNKSAHQTSFSNYFDFRIVAEKKDHPCIILLARFCFFFVLKFLICLCLPQIHSLSPLSLFHFFLFYKKRRKYTKIQSIHRSIPYGVITQMLRGIKN